ncbi:MAG TPA: DUF3048 domain-containing protein [Patescibacteria group bacterium]|nr:DUF3048 domain-containing protein [Patescibacteria group bacterium]
MKRVKINRRLKILLVLLAVSLISLLVVAYQPCQITLNPEWLAGSLAPRYKYFSQLDGSPVINESDQAPAVLGVMIDNLSDARPQYGLTEAMIVYEALAEGGITRFLAIFSEKQTVEMVGPVRSARPYYLDWLAEYGDALYLHCGGSPAALKLIKERNIFDANEFYWGSYYWRSGYQSAPHNIFTNSAKWQAIYSDYGEIHRVSWVGWGFRESPSADGEPIRAVSIKYGPGYQVDWEYVKTEDQGGYYRRFINQEVHRGFRGAEGPFPIEAQNVLLQYTETKVLDDVGRKEITAIGRGEARIFRDGLMWRGLWKKENLSSRTIFYNEQGEEIKLAPGKTWVQVAPKGTAVEITN